MNDKYMKLYTKLSQLQWLLHRHHMQTHAEHGPTADPTKGQGRVLAILKMQSEITTKDLSYLLGIRQQSLNELLNRLEKSGYVVREQSETDRRVMVVKLTEKGKGEQEPPRVDFTDIFTCLSEEEQENFGDYLDRVINALEEQLTTDDQEEIQRWMRAARSKMGNDKFERLMSARGGLHPFRNDHRHHDDARCRGGHGHHGRHNDDPRYHEGHGNHDDPRCQKGPGFHDDPRFRDGWADDERFSRFDGFQGFGPGERGPESRGPAPWDMPGEERFDPDCDGPMPEGRDDYPYETGEQNPHSPSTPPSPPSQPAPPKASHDEEDD